MIFTTVKKRVEKEELFPNDAVMTLVDNKFSLNKKAMELFGFPLNTANTSKIANGYDENNNIILSTMDTKDMYTNNVTTKNDFSSQLLATRLGKFFNYNSKYPVHFQLVLEEEVAGDKFIGIGLINSVNVPFQQIDNAVNGLPLDNIYEYKEEDLVAIETLHADEIAQQGEEVEESPLVYAEVLEKPYEQVDIKVEVERTPTDGVPIKRVINTESW